MSNPAEDCRGSAIVYHAGAIWLGYEIRSAVSVSIVVGSVIDDPEPIPVMMFVASTSYAGNLDLMLHSEKGHLWLTWVHGSEEVGWSEHDAASDAWSAARFESTIGASVDDARDRIRAVVLE